MSEQNEEVIAETTPIETPAEQKTEQIDIDLGTAFNLKIQEFDKKIAEAEFVVATIKKDKMSYVYDQNVQQVVMAHRERVVKAQIEAETKKQLSQK